MTKVALKLLPGARSDIKAALAYFSEFNPELGERFANAVGETYEQLAAMPGIGRPKQLRYNHCPGLRIWRVDEFPEYLIVYQETETEVLISRVLHSARNIDRILNDDE